MAQQEAAQAAAATSEADADTYTYACDLNVARKEPTALQEQLDVARRGLSEVPLLREQLQMAQQEAAQAPTTTAEATTT